VHLAQANSNRAPRGRKSDFLKMRSGCYAGKVGRWRDRCRRAGGPGAAGTEGHPEQLADALSSAATLSGLHRQILGPFLKRLDLIEQQISPLHRTVASAMQKYREAVLGLAAVPGLRPGLSATGHCRGRSGSGNICQCGRTGLLGVRRRVEEQSVAQGEPGDAAGAESSSQCGS